MRSSGWPPRWFKQAQEQGLALTGPDGLLGQLTKTVLETALEAEMTEHLGHAKHADRPGREGTNVRNGSRAKTVVSDAAGEVERAVPRDREERSTPTRHREHIQLPPALDDPCLAASSRESSPSLDAGFFVGAEHEILLLERLAIPHKSVKIEHPGALRAK